MESMDRYPEAQEFITADAVINDVVDNEVANGGIVSPDSIANEVAERSEVLTEDQKILTQKYITCIQGFTHGAVIKTLEDGVGGMYDGSVFIAEETIRIGSSVQSTIEQTEETMAHEAFHKDHLHTQEYITSPLADEGAFVVIGGEEFSREVFIEGLTVLKTGERYVSADYRNRMNFVLNSIYKSDVSLDEVVYASKSHDLTKIDDRSRKNQKHYNMSC